MSNLIIHLNGSNQISKEREQAFQDALDENHQIECADEGQNPVHNNAKISLTNDQSPSGQPDTPTSTKVDTNGNGHHVSPDFINTIEMGLNHSFAHQTRTMEVHQQYLTQQNEDAQLITAAINQQGKVLENEHGPITQGLLDTLQRGLEKFYLIREKGMEIHQKFLNQQADYSERYISILEKQHILIENGTGQVDTPEQSTTQSKPEPISTAAKLDISSEEPVVYVQEDIQVSSDEDSKASNLVIDQELSPEILATALLRIVGEKTGYPPEMLELSMDLEADLGIDSIKRVEILGALEDEFPTLPPADPEILAQTRTLSEIADYMNAEAGQITSNPPAVGESTPVDLSNTDESPPGNEKNEDQSLMSPGGNFSLEELTGILLEIVAEKTGYPVDMLEPGMDMEADLGIDSIKRVEILGAMEEQVPGLPPVEAEVLSELRTLGQIVEIMGNNQIQEKNSPAEGNGVKKKVDPSHLEKTSVKLISLPKPDHLDFPGNQDHPVLVTDDGTELTSQFVSTLLQEGWKVILWSFHDSLIPVNKRDFPKEVYQIQQREPTLDSITSLMNEVRDKFGSLSGFIHLHPLASGGEVFPQTESDIIKQIFFLAGAIKNDLYLGKTESRSLFLTVTRIDGRLGLEDHQVFQESSGFSGLVKTLHKEWPPVFCRSLDLSPELSQEQQVISILEEMHDPDRGIVEVGLGSQDRVTISRKQQG
ncbi:MAG: phosphopantetheine-binding protein [Anaerolineales bacterium]